MIIKKTKLNQSTQKTLFPKKGKVFQGARRIAGDLQTAIVNTTKAITSKPKPIGKKVEYTKPIPKYDYSYWVWVPNISFVVWTNENGKITEMGKGGDRKWVGKYIEDLATYYRNKYKPELIFHHNSYRLTAQG